MKKILIFKLMICLFILLYSCKIHENVETPRTIAIDGNFSDWNNFKPVYSTRDFFSIVPSVLENMDDKEHFKGYLSFNQEYLYYYLDNFSFHVPDKFQFNGKEYDQQIVLYMKFLITYTNNTNKALIIILTSNKSCYFGMSNNTKDYKTYILDEPDRADIYDYFYLSEKQKHYIKDYQFRQSKNKMEFAFPLKYAAPSPIKSIRHLGQNILVHIEGDFSLPG